VRLGLSEQFCNWNSPEWSKYEEEKVTLLSVIEYIECSLCRLIRRPEQLIGRYWLSPGKQKAILSVII
jgi:hypothetical protein